MAEIPTNYIPYKQADKELSLHTCLIVYLQKTFQYNRSNMFETKLSKYVGFPKQELAIAKHSLRKDA